MYKTNDEKDILVQKDIQDGLMAFKKLAKYNIKQRWATMSKSEQLAVARALVLMERVAKDPKKYFSRKQTEYEWFARAEKYAKEHNLKSKYHAFYMVQGPKEKVFLAVIPAIRPGLAKSFYDFLINVQAYEYDREHFFKELHARGIKEQAEKVKQKLDIVESKPVVRMFKKFIRNFYNER